MLQKNLTTGKIRSIRPPYRTHAPKVTEAVPPVVVIEVPPGCAGTEITVPHPTMSSEFILCLPQQGPRIIRKCWFQ